MEIIELVHKYINIKEESETKTSLDQKYEEAIAQQKLLKSDVISVETIETKRSKI